MRTLTLWKAYRNAEHNKKTYRVNRLGHRFGGSYGIAVDNDENARKWQRRDRQSRKFAAEITRRLSDG